MVEARSDLAGIWPDIEVEVGQNEVKPVLIRHFINGIDQALEPESDGLRTRFLTRIGEQEGLSIQWDPAKLEVDLTKEFREEVEKKIFTKRLKGAGWEIIEAESNGRTLVIPFIGRDKYERILANYSGHA